MVELSTHFPVETVLSFIQLNAPIRNSYNDRTHPIGGDRIRKEELSAGGRRITLFLADTAGRPLVVLNEYSGDGSKVADAVKSGCDNEFNLLCVSGLDWNYDMAPWDSPPAFKGDTPCTGGADAYLDTLTKEIIPEALEHVNGKPSSIGIAGYSLAGLFAVYSIYRCDMFDRVASMSGSMWFPDFTDFVASHEPMRRPDRMYISLGDAERNTRNPLLGTVQDRTEWLVSHYREAGLDVTWELNPGNHFKDADLRCAKGIISMISDYIR